MTDEQAMIPVEVAYATPERQLILEVKVPAGSEARDAVMASAIDRYFPELDREQADLAIWGKLARPGQKLEPGDRVEILRPLIADPKEVRRKRAAEGKRMKKGGGDAKPAP
jgi:putative ubiquitin-RnfH superfamily antitoxin RatB of RatAB toxin-antitoxin module